MDEYYVTTESKRANERINDTYRFRNNQEWMNEWIQIHLLRRQTHSICHLKHGFFVLSLTKSETGNCPNVTKLQWLEVPVASAKVSLFPSVFFWVAMPRRSSRSRYEYRSTLTRSFFSLWSVVKCVRRGVPVAKCQLWSRHSFRSRFQSIVSSS